MGYLPPGCNGVEVNKKKKNLSKVQVPQFQAFNNWNCAAYGGSGITTLFWNVLGSSTVFL